MNAEVACSMQKHVVDQEIRGACIVFVVLLQESVGM
jgi:hypothetical protein